uniref:Coiled-coil-helix-coiled-coil-helix domain containing 1 n=1 Tax=Callorhinchus milii TaxID=7868 RepID=A0A4W3GZV4_CALMI
MSSSGGNINAKVSRLLSRSRGRPVLKPNKPLVLANRVANRRLGLGGSEESKSQGGQLGTSWNFEPQTSNNFAPKISKYNKRNINTVVGNMQQIRQHPWREGNESTFQFSDLSSEPMKYSTVFVMRKNY